MTRAVDATRAAGAPDEVLRSCMHVGGMGWFAGAVESLDMPPTRMTSGRSRPAVGPAPREGT
jgi:hypothetical protein